MANSPLTSATSEPVTTGTADDVVPLILRYSRDSPEVRRWLSAVRAIDVLTGGSPTRVLAAHPAALRKAV